MDTPLELTPCQAATKHKIFTAFQAADAAQAASFDRSGGFSEGKNARHGLGLSPLQTNRTVSVPRNDATKRTRRTARLVRASAKAFQDEELFLGRRKKAAFITLTYAKVDEWQPGHISKLMDCYKSWLKRRGYRLHAVWVAELQKRGAVHYHIIIWLPYGLTPPKPDKRGWWPHGSTNCKWARKPAAYLAKYASKGVYEGMKFPKGCRIMGIYNCPMHLGWWRCPWWLAEKAEKGSKITCKAGWWCDWETGWGFRSPWVVKEFTAEAVVVEWRGWELDDIQPIEEVLRVAAVNSALRKHYWSIK